MALKKTGTKAPASRGLDYSLSADILNRVKAAGDNTKLMNTAGMIGQVGATVGKAFTDVVAKNKKQAEEQAALKAEAEGKWDECFQKVGNRGSWATPEVYDQFAELEKDYQTEYNDAIKAGDKQLAAKLLKQQENRSAQLQQWKSVVEGSKDTYDQDLWAENMNPNDKAIINAINAQENAQIAYSEDGSMIFNITMPNGEVRPVTLAEYNKIAQRNVKPVAVEKSWGESMQKINEMAAQNTTFNFEPGSQQYNNQLSTNRKMITRDNYNVMFDNNFVGGEGTFAEHMLTHPDFSTTKLADLKIGENQNLKKYDKNNDGILNADETTAEAMAEFSEDDKVAVIDLMRKEENFDVAKDYLGEYMTLMQYQNAKTTRKEYENERTEANKNSKYNPQ